MKKFLLLSMLLPLLALMACSKDEEPKEDKFETQIITVNGVSFKMIKVEGGTFTMGARDDDSEAKDSEKPAHRVTVSTFAIGETEVTQELWLAVMGGENPSYFNGVKDGIDYGTNLKRPVEMVNWNTFQEFIARLNELTGMKFRLPTEAEWEFAAHGGNRSNGYLFSGGNDPIDVAWFHNNSEKKSRPVGQKAANELGIYDMTGNVREFCSDWFDNNYYSISPQVNPKGPETGNVRVLRGGSWAERAPYCRLSEREGWDAKIRSNIIGYRLAL